MSKKFYAVKKGRKTGIFNDWETCRSHIDGYSGAIFKSFKCLEDAKNYINDEDKKNDETSVIKAYVDGSFNKLTKAYGSGVAILKDGEIIKLNKSGDNEEMATMRNVAGEIIASSMAMDWFEQNAEILNGYSLEIYYDYTGIENWALGNWKTNKEGTKKYKKRATEFMKKYSLRFVKVKAHSGNKYNDMADELAKSAVF